MEVIKLQGKVCSLSHPNNFVCLALAETGWSTEAMPSRWAYPTKKNTVYPAEICIGGAEILSIENIDEITFLDAVEKALVARIPLDTLKTLLLESDPIEQMEMMRALPGGIMAKTIIR